MLQNIDINKIYPHLKNPRIDLGDLSELADSIKLQGILQNLTVIPKDPQGYCSSCIHYNAGVGKCADGHDKGMRPPCQKWESDGKYTVVIGHRRLAAAKLAGLTEVPCTVTEMDYKTQISTMLLENIQRNDLTVYEQAQGFQMMLNLGETPADISQRTGFSESTVRRRVKLLELDQEKFKAADTRGASLADYMELDKIKNTERKNAILDKIGTDNFKYELGRAITTEAQEERVSKWIEVLSTFATQIDNSTGYRRVKYYYTSNEPGNCERPEDADSKNYYFIVSKYGSIEVMIKDDEQNSQSEESFAEKQKRERLAYRSTELAKVTKLAYNLRKDFINVVSNTNAKKHLSDILAFSLIQKMGSYTNLDEADLIELLGITLDEESEDDELTYDMVYEAIHTYPEKALLISVYCECNDGERKGYYTTWSYVHKADDDLDELYKLLKKLGYKMSDDERKLQDGTHELFTAEPELGYEVVEV